MYPVWEGIGTHSAMYVAVIAVFHVIASHLTVGAAWFNLYVERKAVRQDRPELYEYLRRSALGLQVFAYVFGAMAGVGIWQSTTAANPRGISGLIHNFVLVWGSEWYMFMIDVLGIITYYYTLGRVDRKTHLRLAWILALGGTGTLSLIVGILGFKLTPGKWLTTGEPLLGFYNPTFWPQFFLRLFMMLAITGAWGIVIAARMKKDFVARRTIIRWAGLIGMGGLAVSMAIGRFWYHHNLSPHAKEVLTSRAVPAITYDIVFGGVLIVFVFLLVAAIAPSRQTTLGGLAMFSILFVAVFGAERTREIMRKPDVINGYMSSNGLVFQDMPFGVANEEAALSANGMMGNLPFVPALESIDVTGADYPTVQIAAGHNLVAQQCASCHSISDQTVIDIGGTQLALRQQSRLFGLRLNLRTAEGIRGYLDAIGSFPYMHEVVGDEEDLLAMAAYLAWVTEQQHPQATAEGDDGHR